MMLVTLLTALAPFVAQEAPAPKAPSRAAEPTAQAAKPAVATRADLARAYLRFETTLHDHPPAPERWPEINRAFDALTVDFFMGKGAAAIAKLEDLTISVSPGPVNLSDWITVALDGSGNTQNPPSLRVIVSNARRDAAGFRDARLVFRAIEFASALPAEDSGASWSVAELATQPRILSMQECGVVVKGYDLALAPTSEPAANPRTYRWCVRQGDADRALPYAFLDTFAFTTTLQAIDETLKDVVPEGPPMEQALASCRARAQLLHSPRSTDQSCIFLQDLHGLAAQVRQEAQRIAAGTDPYRRKHDDHWRVVRVGDKDLPVRVFAPEARGPAHHPLVIALHGAGGDENMFFDGYGAGRIKELATDRNFVCVTPRVGFTGLSGETFDAIVRAMVYDYDIDPKRIYVLGHSMGAGAAYSLAVSRADKLAAVACIAGGAQGSAPKSIAPLLVVAGELDPIVNASGLEQGSQRFKTAGLPVEFQLVKGFGHTLVVGEKLPAVVDWLLTHTR